MSPVIFKAQVVGDCGAGNEPSSGGSTDGVFRMGWFSVSGNDPNASSPTDYEYIRSRLTRILCLPKSQDFDVFFKDTDGKRKVINQDEELRRAVSLLDDGMCKVYVCLKGPAMACG